MLKVLALITVLTISTDTSALCQVSSVSLENVNTFSCTGDLKNESANFYIYSHYNESLFISGQEHSGCGDFPSYVLYELDADDKEVEAFVMVGSVEMKADTNYRLEASIQEPHCQKYTNTFTIEKF